ncbi:MAG: hypothetical protein WCQ03_10600, partial [Phycisphaerae bacterium]
MPIRFALFIVLVINAALNALALAQDSPAQTPEAVPEVAPPEPEVKPAAKPVAPKKAPSAAAGESKKNAASAKNAEALKELNLFWKGVSEKNRSASLIFLAWIAATPMPSAVAPSPENIWPGMEGFADWKK